MPRPAGFANFRGAGRGGARLAFLRGGAGRGGAPIPDLFDPENLQTNVLQAIAVSFKDSIPGLLY